MDGHLRVTIRGEPERAERQEAVLYAILVCLWQVGWPVIISGVTVYYWGEPERAHTNNIMYVHALHVYVRMLRWPSTMHGTLGPMTSTGRPLP